MSDQSKKVKLQDNLFRYTAFAFTMFTLLVLAVLLIDIISNGIGRINWSFFTNLPSRHPEKSGIYTALAGMLTLLFLTIIFSLPIGILAGVYLQEYAQKNRFAKILEINIANLAGVPSIIYGTMW